MMARENLVPQLVVIKKCEVLVFFKMYRQAFGD